MSVEAVRICGFPNGLVAHGNISVDTSRIGIFATGKRLLSGSLSGSEIIRTEGGKTPWRITTDFRMQPSRHMAVISVVGVELTNRWSFVSTTSKTMGQNIGKRLALKAVTDFISGFSTMAIRLGFRCFARIAITQSIGMAASYLNRSKEGATTIESLLQCRVSRVGPSGPKRPAPHVGDDIVCSAWKHAAAAKAAASTVACRGEHQDENQLGVATGLIWGLKKLQFNSEDFSTIVVSTGISAAAGG